MLNIFIAAVILVLVVVGALSLKVFLGKNQVTSKPGNAASGRGCGCDDCGCGGGK